MPSGLSGGLCGICSLKPSKYVCPKCSRPYCSLSCYKDPSHESCSESFYKAEVEDELRGAKVSDEQRKAMLSLLGKFEQESLDQLEIEEEMDDEERGAAMTDLFERLGGLDLKNSNALEILSKLHPDEIAAFENVISKDEGLASLVPLWTPWWNSSLDCDALPPLSLPSTPLPPTPLLSPKLLYNLLDILFSYAFTSRFLNGDLDEDVSGAWMILKAHSKILSESVPFAFDNVGAVMGHVQERCFKLGKMYGHTLGSLGSLFKDVTKLLQTPRITVHALSEIQDRILQPLSRNATFKALKKVEFYTFAVTQTVFCKSPSTGDWPPWVDKVRDTLDTKSTGWIREHDSMEEMIHNPSLVSSGHQRMRTPLGKSLIEEIL